MTFHKHVAVQQITGVQAAKYAAVVVEKVHFMGQPKTSRDDEISVAFAGLTAGETARLFITDITDLDLVQKALPEQGFTVESAKIGYRPKNPVSLSGEALEEVEAFLAAIDEDDDVHEVYVGLAGE